MKNNKKEEIKNLIENEKITKAKDLAEKTGLSINRVYEIRKELGYGKTRKNKEKNNKETAEKNENTKNGNTKQTTNESQNIQES